MNIHDSDLLNDLARDRMLHAARRRRSRRRLKQGLAACVPLILAATIILNRSPADGPDGNSLVSRGGPEEASVPIWATPRDVPAVSDNALLAALSEGGPPVWAGPSDHPPALDDQLLRALAD